MRAPDGPKPWNPNYPLVSLAGMLPPALAVAGWWMLQRSIDALAFLGGLAVAVVFALGACLCFVGAFAGWVGRRTGERPGWLPPVVIGVNVVALLWLVSVLE